MNLNMSERWIAGLAALMGVSGTCHAQAEIWRTESKTVGDLYGTSRLGPDLDGDGLPELLISGPGGTCSSQYDGYVSLVSVRSGELFRWCGAGAAYFGNAHDWIGDVDGGGVADVVIAEPYYYEPSKFGRDTGRIQVYSTETRSLLYEVVGTQGSGSFGAPACKLDDIDGDGVADFFVGAPSYGWNGDGQVWAFSGKTGTQVWTDVGSSASYFGSRIASLGDIDGDGVGDCIAHGEPTDLGEVRVYSGATGAILHQLVGSGAFDTLGWALATPGDLDGDGLADVVCSGAAPSTSGHVDAYSGVTGAPIWKISGPPPPPKGLGEAFGNFVCCVGDINQDGFDDLLVTSWYDDHDGRDVGRVDLISGRNQRSLYRFYAGMAGLASFGNLLQRGVDFDGDGFEDMLIGTSWGGRNKSKGGHIAIYAGNDLFLQADPLKPGSAETVIVDLRGGEPSTLGLIALSAIDGAPLFEPLLVTAFDANGEIQLQADTDPSVSGHDFTIVAYAVNRAGRGPLMDSSTQTVEVQ